MSHVNSNIRGVTYMLLALVALAGCSNQLEPAKKAIAGVEAAIAAAGPDAQKFIPDQIRQVTDQLAGLKAKLDAKDYAGVLAGAPALLTSAQGLVAAKDTAIKAAAEKLAAAQAAAEEAMKADWTLLASAVPSAITAVDSRVSMLAKSKKLPAGVTKDALTAAQNSLASAKTLWGEAASAQTAGKLGDAVAAAKQAKDSIDAALAGLGMSAG